ncbi:MAG: hypothetical protein U0930_12545 [Pirellulales bacterium]
MIPFVPSTSSLSTLKHPILAKSQLEPTMPAAKEMGFGDVTQLAISQATTLLNPKFWWIATFIAVSLLSLLHVIHFAGFPRFYYLPATIAVCAFLVLQLWNRVPRLPSSRSSLGLILASTLTLLLAIVLGMPWFAGLSLILLFAAFCQSHFDCSNHRLTRLVFPALFLLPLPQVIDSWLTDSVELVLSMVASTMLDLADITHRIVAGTCNFSFGIVELSLFSQGINSFQAVAFAATLLCIWMGRTTWLLPAYLLSAFAVTVLTTLVQLLVFQSIGASASLATAEGLSRSVLGVLALVCSFALLTSFDRLILILFSPVEDSSLGRLFYNPIIKTWDYVLGQNQVDPKTSQERLIVSTLNKPSELTRWLLIGSALIMLTSVPIQAWQCYKALTSQHHAQRDLAKLSKQLSASLPVGWSLTEINDSVNYEPPVLADKAVQYTFEGSNTTLRLALIQTSTLHSWIPSASRLGWKVQAEQDNTSKLKVSSSFSAYVLSRDNRQLAMFEVAFAKQSGIGLINTYTNYCLKRLESELEHEKYFQLRFTTSSADGQTGGQADFQQIVETVTQQFEIALNMKMQEKQ